MKMLKEVKLDTIEKTNSYQNKTGSKTQLNRETDEPEQGKRQTHKQH